MMVLLLVSCRTQSGPGPEAIGELDVPGYEDLAAVHNSRVEKLGTIAARGVIEMWWTDDDGRHYEQGELDLWIALPCRTALNISKLGHRFMWIGSDESQTWLFDFRGGLTTLHLADPGQDLTVGVMPFEPTLLLDLGGLTPLPAAGGEVRYARDHDAWEVRAPDRPVLFLDRESLLPVRAELLDETGGILLYSAMKLSRYERVKRKGVSPLGGPMFPTLINIKSTDGRFKVQLSARGPNDSGVNADFFDIGWLKGWFKPERAAP
jgi:hypothetical protein